MSVNKKYIYLQHGNIKKVTILSNVPKDKDNFSQKVFFKKKSKTSLNLSPKKLLDTLHWAAFQATQWLKIQLFTT